MTTFEEIGVPASLTASAAAMGWAAPTPIQEQAVPAGIAGRDLIARAQTGTGKTGAYALILMSRLPAGGRRPSALVIAPTRELAIQIDGELQKLARGSGHVSTAVYGGARYGLQSEALRRGVDIVVGTPGRLRDMTERGILILDEVKTVVLDEADRMLDMGFEEDLDFLIGAVPKPRQTLMFSATMTKGVERLAESKLSDPVKADVSVDEPVTGLTRQYAVPVMRNEKREVLQQILNNGTPKAIVFCATKLMVETLYEELHVDRKTGMLHGDMPQSLRERVIRQFRENRILVLLATDVAARGLDVNDVDLVVNFDAPSEPETYLHRIGRTGRAGKEGVAVTLYTRQETHRMYDYEEITESRIRNASPEELEPIEAVHEPVPLEPRPERRERRPRMERRDGRGPATVVLQVGLGRDDGLNRTQVADFVRSRARLGENDVGKVGLGNASSFVEVRTDVAEKAVADLSGCIHDRKVVTAVIAPRKTPYAEKVGHRS
ncbi:MAG: DEAD/DEAH box helicase [Methanomethylophilus sp.]